MILIVCRLKGIASTSSVEMRRRSAALIRLGDRVKRRRHNLGLTQEGLADSADLHRTYIGGVEWGERNLSVLNLVRICEALRLDPAELVRGLRSSL